VEDLKSGDMPTIDIPERVCSHCGGTKWKVEKEKRRYSIRIRYRCAKKEDERNKRWRLANPERAREYEKKRVIDWKSPKKREFYRLREERQRTEITDKYVRYLLRHNPIYRNSIITPQMIENYRTYLKASRQLKNIENGKKGKQTQSDRRSSVPNGRESKKRI
jgi:hypothetical protein